MSKQDVTFFSRFENRIKRWIYRMTMGRANTRKKETNRLQYTFPNELLPSITDEDLTADEIKTIETKNKMAAQAINSIPAALTELITTREKVPAERKEIFPMLKRFVDLKYHYKTMIRLRIPCQKTEELFFKQAELVYWMLRQEMADIPGGFGADSGDTLPGESAQAAT